MEVEAEDLESALGGAVNAVCHQQLKYVAGFRLDALLAVTMDDDAALTFKFHNMFGLLDQPNRALPKKPEQQLSSMRQRMEATVSNICRHKLSTARKISIEGFIAVAVDGRELVILKLDKVLQLVEDDVSSTTNSLGSLGSSVTSPTLQSPLGGEDYGTIGNMSNLMDLIHTMDTSEASDGNVTSPFSATSESDLSEASSVFCEGTQNITDVGSSIPAGVISGLPTGIIDNLQFSNNDPVVESVTYAPKDIGSSQLADLLGANLFGTLPSVQSPCINHDINSYGMDSVQKEISPATSSDGDKRIESTESISFITSSTAPSTGHGSNFRQPSPPPKIICDPMVSLHESGKFIGMNVNGANDLISGKKLPPVALPFTDTASLHSLGSALDSPYSFTVESLTNFVGPSEVVMRITKEATSMSQLEAVLTSSEESNCSTGSRGFNDLVSDIFTDGPQGGSDVGNAGILKTALTKSPTRLIRGHSGKIEYTTKATESKYKHVDGTYKPCNMQERRKPFRCHKCGKEYSQSLSLKRHKQGKVACQYVCPKCRESFCVEEAFSAHLRKHLGSNPFICEVCKKSFPDKDSLREHTNVHQMQTLSDLAITKLLQWKDQLFNGGTTCCICRKTFSTIYNMRRHILSHKIGANDSATEGYLKNGFRRKFEPHSLLDLSLQKVAHEYDSKESRTSHYTCVYCAKGPMSKFDIIRHLESHKRSLLKDAVANGQKNYPCKHCRSQFTLESTLNLHIQQVHERKVYDAFGKPVFECVKCHTQFKGLYNLERHMALHKFHDAHGENFSRKRPYKCLLCKNTFASEKNLQLHQEQNHEVLKSTNTEVKRGNLKEYICPFCNRKFPNMFNLNRHEAIHRKNGGGTKKLRPFSCQVCGLSYHSKRKLVEHVNDLHKLEYSVTT